MKKNILFAIVICVALLALSCSKQSTPTQKRQQSNVQNPIELAIPIANSFTDFSFFFFKKLQATQQAGDNIFVSPLSLHIALGMLANGAEGETKSQIFKTLKSENLSQDELNKAYKTLLTELPKADPLVQMALANAIFYKNTFPVEQPFLSTMQNSFNAQITGLPFVPSDKDIVNKWASDHTNGKIPKVLDEIKPEHIMFLLNALYFKGDWRSKFDKKNTKDQPFYLQGGGQKTVKMMNQKDTFMMASGNNFSALSMLYGNGQFNITLLLPNEGKTIASVMEALDIDQWNSLQSKFYNRTVEVGLPKFKLEQKFELKNTLQNMGMSRAFVSGMAQLQGINKTVPLFVDFVNQNTFAAVDEEGTEAAAVTIIGVGLTSAGPIETPQFICDRPFGLVISEKTSNTILFMGRIMNP